MNESSQEMLPEWRGVAFQYAADLAEIGILKNLYWYAAVALTPRHLLMPVAYLHRDGGWVRLDTSALTGMDWVYSSFPLATNLVKRDGRQEAVSYATKPRLVVQILELMDIDHGGRVLEIGTDIGYGAALLSHYLHEYNVFSVDADPKLVKRVRRRLAAIGHRPTLVAADIEQGLPEYAPYDRIISTCFVSRIPWKWIEQTAIGGRVVADLKIGPCAGNLIALDRTEFGAQGRFFAWWASFTDMPNGVPAIAAVNQAELLSRSDKSSSPRTYETDVPMQPWSCSVPWFLAHFSLPKRIKFVCQFSPDGMDTTAATIITTDGSTRVDITDDGQKRRATENGPFRVWEAIQTGYDTWTELGEPRWSAFGMTITRHHQTIWFDHPASARTWQL